MKTISQKRMHKGGFNIAWMIPINMVAFSILAAIGLRFGLVAVVPAAIVHLLAVNHLGISIEQMADRKVVKKTVAKKARAKKTLLNLQPAFQR